MSGEEYIYRSAKNIGKSLFQQAVREAHEVINRGELKLQTQHDITMVDECTNFTDGDWARLQAYLERFPLGHPNVKVSR